MRREQELDRRNCGNDTRHVLVIYETTNTWPRACCSIDLSIASVRSAGSFALDMST